MKELATAPLGQSVKPASGYAPEILFPVARELKRSLLNISSQSLPFTGFDIWNAYELSWLNLRGKPVVGIAEFIFPCQSLFLIESKSMKLYLNSFNQMSFASKHALHEYLIRDLRQCTGAEVQIKIFLLEELPLINAGHFQGICLDHLDISCNTYELTPEFLKTSSKEIVEETLYSNLLKTNCLVTGQPDWASVKISYRGEKINPAGLLSYIISFRHHLGFHEHCVEQIFIDILRRCKPERLSIEAHFTRRGGIDINPYRSTHFVLPKNTRLIRQ